MGGVFFFMVLVTGSDAGALLSTLSMLIMAVMSLLYLMLWIDGCFSCFLAALDAGYSRHFAWGGCGYYISGG